MYADPPIPSDPAEAVRIDHSRLRRRMMSGTWRDDLAMRMRRNLGSVRSEAVGEPDMSANPFEAVCTGSSALYDLPPAIKNPDPLSVQAMSRFAGESQLWPMMARNQAVTLAQRELLLKVTASVQAGRPEVVYTPVYIDLALLEADPYRPSKPIRVRHAVQRAEPVSGRTIWTWDDWSISGTPYYRILASDGQTDVSAAFGLPAGGQQGEAYPMFRADGRPILPFSTYHAAVTGYLLDPFYRRELVEGNLNVGVLWTFFSHCIRAASWPQRYLIGGAVASERAEGNVRRIVADPATILEVLADPNFEGQPSAGQWGSASDPKAVAEAIGMYEARFTAYAGMDPSDLQRTSGDPRSGYALAISQEGRIRAQRRYAPVFAPADAETLAVTAVAVNRALGGAVLAEDGWEVEHTALPPSVEQQQARRTEAMELFRAGFISLAKARSMVLGETEAEAQAQLDAMAAMRAKEGGAADVTLAGAQTQALVGVVSAVTKGELPAAGAIAILRRSYGLSAEEAAAMLEGAEGMALQNEQAVLALDALEDGDTAAAMAILRGGAGAVLASSE